MAAAQFDPETDDAPELTLEQQLAQEREARLAAERDRDREREEREREARRVDDYLRGPKQQAQEQPLPPMPDPAEDPQAFQNWLNERDRRAALKAREEREEIRRETRETITSEASRIELWNEFRASYPEHAKLTELAGAAYSKVASSNPQGSNSEILKRVAAEMDRLAGRAIGQGKRADRTKGLSGGEPPRKVQRSQESDGEDHISIHDAASSMREKHGFA